jgi:hypothetical protein
LSLAMWPPFESGNTLGAGAGHVKAAGTAGRRGREDSERGGAPSDSKSRDLEAD